MPFIYEEKCICMAPKSPDLNPVDYAAWRALLEISSLDNLKNSAHLLGEA